MSDDNLMHVRDRNLPYRVFDADNHLYETTDAFTRYLPKSMDGVVKYIEINGRTKLALRDRISDYIPNPTFAKVAAPGAWGIDPAAEGGIKDHGPMGRLGLKPKVIPGVEAFFDPEPRYELMQDMGIDRTIMWPTLASVLEERLADDPRTTCALIHALNQWIHEHWTFNYNDSIFATPIVSLSILDKAIEEIQWVAERGAKIFLLRVAPVPTYEGRKSFALPEFDPFWELVQELDLVVGMHSGDSGYTRYTDEWEGREGAEFLAFAANTSLGFLELASEKNNLVDAMASIIGHGLASRFPKLKFAPVEFQSTWIRPFADKLRAASETKAAFFDEDPYEVFIRNVYIHCFHEPDPAGLIAETGIPADHLMFGSDFPHPEGMADPLAYSDLVQDLPQQDQELIMGGTLAKIMGV